MKKRAGPWRHVTTWDRRGDMVSVDGSTTDVMVNALTMLALHGHDTLALSSGSPEGQKLALAMDAYVAACDAFFNRIEKKEDFA